VSAPRRIGAWIVPRSAWDVRIALLLIMALVLAVFGRALISATGCQPQDTRVEIAFRKAMAARAALAVPLGDHKPLAAGQAAIPPSSEQVAQSRASGQAEIARYFSGPAAQQVLAGLEAAFGAGHDPSHHLIAAGVSNVTIHTIEVDGSQATVTASVTQWTRAQKRDANGEWVDASTSAVVDYTAQMARGSDGDWRITKLEGGGEGSGSTP
jgi:hypothetical protein